MYVKEGDTYENFYYHNAKTIKNKKFSLWCHKNRIFVPV